MSAAPLPLPNDKVVAFPRRPNNVVPLPLPSQEKAAPSPLPDNVVKFPAPLPDNVVEFRPRPLEPRDAPKATPKNPAPAPKPIAPPQPTPRNPILKGVPSVARSAGVANAVGNAIGSLSPLNAPPNSMDGPFPGVGLIPPDYPQQQDPNYVLNTPGVVPDPVFASNIPRWFDDYFWNPLQRFLPKPPGGDPENPGPAPSPQQPAPVRPSPPPVDPSVPIWQRPIQGKAGTRYLVGASGSSTNRLGQTSRWGSIDPPYGRSDVVGVHRIVFYPSGAGVRLYDDAGNFIRELSLGGATFDPTSSYKHDGAWSYELANGSPAVAPPEPETDKPPFSIPDTIPQTLPPGLPDPDYPDPEPEPEIPDRIPQQLPPGLPEPDYPPPVDPDADPLPPPQPEQPEEPAPVTPPQPAPPPPEQMPYLPGPDIAPNPIPTPNPPPDPSPNPNPPPLPDQNPDPNVNPLPSPQPTPYPPLQPVPYTPPIPGPNPVPSPNPNPVPTPDPIPTPNPNPSPYPTPNPTPGDHPSPSPNPFPNPNPVPSPNPNPAPTPNPVPTPNPNPNPAPNPFPNPNPGDHPNPIPTPNPTPNPIPSPNHNPFPNPGLQPAPMPVPSPPPYAPPVSPPPPAFPPEPCHCAPEPMTCRFQAIKTTGVPVRVFLGCLPVEPYSPLFATRVVSCLEGQQGYIAGLFDQVASLAADRCGPPGDKPEELVEVRLPIIDCVKKTVQENGKTVEKMEPKENWLTVKVRKSEKQLVLAQFQQLAEIRRNQCKTEDDNGLLKRVYKILGGDKWFPKLGDKDANADEKENPLLKSKFDEQFKKLAASAFDEKTGEEKELDSANLLDYLGGVLGSVYHRSGFESFPTKVAESLLSVSDGVEPKEIRSMANYLHWYIEQFDLLLGQWPIEIEIEDSDPLKSGNQVKKVQLPNLSEAIAETYALAISGSTNADLSINFLMRLASEVIATKNSSLITQDYVKANASFLGYRGTAKKREIPYNFNPSKLDDLGDFLKESKGYIVGWEEQDKETVVAFLQRLMFSAGIIKAVFMRDKKRMKTIQDELKSMLETPPEDEEGWRKFIDLINQEKSQFNVKETGFDYPLSKLDNEPVIDPPKPEDKKK